MPVVNKITESEFRKKRGRPIGSKNKIKPIPVKAGPNTADVPTYTWRCKNNHTQIVHIRLYDCLCGTCKQEMKCDDKGGLK